MSCTPVGRLSLALAAALLLALPAPPPVAALDRSAAPGVLGPLWQWLHGLWAADGGAIDPLGVKALASPPHVGISRVSPSREPYRTVVGADGGMIDPLGVKALSAPRHVGARRKGLQQR